MRFLLDRGYPIDDAPDVATNLLKTSFHTAPALKITIDKDLIGHGRLKYLIPLTDLHPYYRRWKKPWTYAIYCRDDRKVPVINLPASSPLFDQ
jgi:hypothetical protein